MLTSRDAGTLFLTASVKYLAQGNHHEVALVHQRMRYLQVGLIDNKVVIEQDIDVDRTVVIRGER